MPKPSPVRRSSVLWAIADPMGALMQCTVRSRRRYTIAACVKGSQHSWPALKAQGYRAVKVRIVPIEGA